MKTLTIAAVSTLLVVAFPAAPARAADGFYFGVGAAPAWLNADFRYADGSKVSPDFDTGVMVDLTAGFSWGGWRVEAEPYFTLAETSSAEFQGGLATAVWSVAFARPGVHAGRGHRQNPNKSHVERHWPACGHRANTNFFEFLSGKGSFRSRTGGRLKGVVSLT
jgi:hypothetical protein